MSLPAEAPALVQRLAGRITHRADQKISAGEILAATRSAATAAETFVELPLPGYYAPFKYTAASYTPVPYLVPAIVFALGRLTSTNLLVLFFIARVANLLLATAILYFAVREMPFLQWIVALLALTPMALFMRASLSADGVVMAIACLLTSLILRTAAEERPARNAALTTIVVLTLLLCLTKPIFVLPLLALVIPRSKFPTGRTRMIFFAALLCATLAGLRLSAIFSDEVFSALPLSSPVQPRAQASFVIHHPLSFAAVLGRTWLDYSPRYFGELIGKLGWVDTPMPGWLIASWYALLLLVTFTRGPDPVSFSGWQRGITIGVMAAGSFLIFLTLYFTWNRVGAQVIDGVQGRYFLPLATLVFVAIGQPRLSLPEKFARDGDAWFACLTAVGLIVALRTMIGRFYQ